MKYLGVVKQQGSNLILPDAFGKVAPSSEVSYEAIQIGSDILLMAPPLDRTRLKLVEDLTRRSISEHRETLEGLAR